MVIKTFLKLFFLFRAKSVELTKTTDLSLFIVLAETVQRFDYGYFKYSGIFKVKLYTDFFKFANRPEILQDIDKLKRANQLHVQLLVDMNYDPHFQEFDYR